MNSNHAIRESKKFIKQRNLAIIACGGLLFSNLFLSLVLLFQNKTTILVPNSLDQEATVVSGKMSPSYVEAHTRDIVNTMLNVTPSNVEYAAKSILKMTHPKFYGQLKKALNERSKDIINRKISIFFAPQSISITEDKNSVFVVGKLSTYLGKEEVSQEEKTYSITYKFEGFKPLVIDFREVDPKAKIEEAHEKTLN